MEEMEKCTLCHKDTEVLQSLPVWKRENYLESTGQLCKECYVEVAQNRSRHNLA